MSPKHKRNNSKDKDSGSDHDSDGNKNKKKDHKKKKHDKSNDTASDMISDVKSNPPSAVGSNSGGGGGGASTATSLTGTTGVSVTSGGTGSSAVVLRIGLQTYDRLLDADFAARFGFTANDLIKRHVFTSGGGADAQKDITDIGYASFFYRCTPLIFYNDLAAGFPQRLTWTTATAAAAATAAASASDVKLGAEPMKLTVGADTHIGNFGLNRASISLMGPSAAGTSAGAVCGMNDFDQSGVGSPGGDLARLAVSQVLASQFAGEKDEQQLMAGVMALADSYFSTVHSCAAGSGGAGSSGGSAPPYIAAIPNSTKEGEVTINVPKSPLNPACEAIAKGLKKSVNQGLEGVAALAKYTALDEKKPNALPPNEIKLTTQRSNGNSTGLTLIALDAANEYKVLCETVINALERNDSKSNAGLRVDGIASRSGAGGSSYGLPRFVLLCRRTGDDPKTVRPFVIEVKAILRSSLLVDGLVDGQSVERQNQLGGYHNTRTAMIKWKGPGITTAGGEWFYVREIEPEKEDVKPKGSAEIAVVAQHFAKLLALAHCHANARAAAAITSWIGAAAKANACEGLANWAIRYAAQVKADHKAYAIAHNALPKEILDTL